MGQRDHLTRLHISHALGERSVRVAVIIAEGLVHLADLADEQPTAVIDALIEYWGDKARSEQRPARREMYKSAVRYSETILEEAHERERRLLYGIMGTAPDLKDHELPHGPIDQEPLDEDR